MQHGLPIYMHHDREGHTVPGRQVDMGTREVLLLVVTRERRENALTSSGLWPGALASTPISSSNDKSYKAMSNFQSRSFLPTNYAKAKASSPFPFKALPRTDPPSRIVHLYLKGARWCRISFRRRCGRGRQRQFWAWRLMASVPHCTAG